MGMVIDSDVNMPIKVWELWIFEIPDKEEK